MYNNQLSNSFWNTYFKEHPVPRVDTVPSFNYGRHCNVVLLAKAIDDIEKKNDIPCQIVFCTVDSTYYIVPE